MKDDKPRIHIHEQVSNVERKKMPRGLNEHAYYKNRPSYKQSPRSWSNSRADMDAGRPKFKFHVPEWLLPANGVDIWHTITASIVWGICGRMADMENES